MLDIGGWEFMLVAFVLILVVGPKELPKMLRSFTRITQQVRRMAREFTDGMNDLAREAEVEDIKKAMDDVRAGNLSNLADVIDNTGESAMDVVTSELNESTTALKSIRDEAEAVGSAIEADTKEPAIDPAIEQRGSNSNKKPAAKKKAAAKKAAGKGA